MRCNPLAKVDKDTLKQLRDEMADARRDSRELARFLSYRLNLPTADESEMLLTVTRLGPRDGAPRSGCCRAVPS